MEFPSLTESLSRGLLMKANSPNLRFRVRSSMKTVPEHSGLAQKMGSFNMMEFESQRLLRLTACQEMMFDQLPRTARDAFGLEPITAFVLFPVHNAHRRQTNE